MLLVFSHLNTCHLQFTLNRWKLFIFNHPWNMHNHLKHPICIHLHHPPTTRLLKSAYCSAIFPSFTLHQSIINIVKLIFLHTLTKLLRWGRISLPKQITLILFKASTKYYCQCFCVAHVVLLLLTSFFLIVVFVHCLGLCMGGQILCVLLYISDFFPAFPPLYCFQCAAICMVYSNQFCFTCLQHDLVAPYSDCLNIIVLLFLLLT